MNAQLLLGGLSLLSLSTPRLAPTAEYDLRFRAVPGMELEKSFTSHYARQSEEFSVTMAGNPVPEQFLPELLFESELEMNCVVRDRYEAPSAGETPVFTREYDQLFGLGNWSFEMPPQSAEGGNWEHRSDLEGKSVKFEWDEGSGLYSRTIQSQREQPEELQKLSVAMNLEEFLPEEAVALGDTWVIDGAVVSALLRPGGELGLHLDADDDEAPFQLVEASGELTVRLSKVAKLKGVQVAVLLIEGSYVLEEKRPTTLERVPVADGTATEFATTNLELEGELIWDLEAGLPLLLELESSLDEVVETIRDPGQGGSDYSSEMTFGGEVEIRVEFSVVSQ